MDPILESDQCHLMSSFKEIERPLDQCHFWLVVEPYPSEKYDFVSLDDDIPNIWKNKKCSKPPTSILIFTGVQVPVSDPFDDDNDMTIVI